MIIFKKIIKFIALICLLLFLPKLQPKNAVSVTDLFGMSDEDESDESEEHRSIGAYCEWKYFLR